MTYRDEVSFRKRSIYGIAEIAEKLGIKPNAVAQWKRRGKLPDPDEELATGPVWLARTLTEFFGKETQSK